MHLLSYTAFPCRLIGVQQECKMPFSRYSYADHTKSVEMDDTKYDLTHHCCAA